MSGQSTSQALGCRISLTSNSEIRYEGFLFAINEQENTVSLMNVRMFGTEGRRESPSEEVPPGECLYEHLVFSGADIKNLTVYEETPLPKDPAILSGKAASTPASDPAHVGASSSQQPHKKQASYETRRHTGPAQESGSRPPTSAHPTSDRGGYSHGRGNGSANSNRSRRRHNEGYQGSYQGYVAQSHAPSYYDHHHQPNGRSAPSSNARGNAPPPTRGRGMGYEGRAGGMDTTHRGGYYEHHRAGHHPNANAHASNPHAHHHHSNHHHNNNNSNTGTHGHDGNGDSLGNNHRRGGGYRRRRGGQQNHGNNGPVAGGAPHRRRDRAHTGQDFEVAQDAAAARAEFEGDFDFDSNNKKLVSEAKEVAGGAREQAKAEESGQARKGYDKTSSFFDTISCETREKRIGAGGGDGRGGRPAREDREVAHKIDLETFGTELVQSQRRDGAHNGVRRGYVRRR